MAYGVSCVLFGAACRLCHPHSGTYEHPLTGQLVFPYTRIFLVVFWLPWPTQVNVHWGVPSSNLTARWNKVWWYSLTASQMNERHGRDRHVTMRCLMSYVMSPGVRLRPLWLCSWSHDDGACALSPPTMSDQRDRLSKQFDEKWMLWCKGRPQTKCSGLVGQKCDETHNT